MFWKIGNPLFTEKGKDNESFIALGGRQLLPTDIKKNLLLSILEHYFTSDFGTAACGQGAFSTILLFPPTFTSKLRNV